MFTSPEIKHRSNYAIVLALSSSQLPHHESRIPFKTPLSLFRLYFPGRTPVELQELETTCKNKHAIGRIRSLENYLGKTNSS